MREVLGRLADAGYAHGDLSPYNVLVHDGRLVLIDLPQAVDLVGNPQGFAFLRRDCDNICTWFRHAASTPTRRSCTTTLMLPCRGRSPRGLGHGELGGDLGVQSVDELVEAARRVRPRHRVGCTPTVPAATSSSPTTSTYGSFSSFAVRMRLPELIVGLDDVDTEALGGQPGCNIGGVGLVGLGDRQHPSLHRCHPRRERAGVVLEQHAEEPLDRAEQGAVQHDRSMAGIVGADVLEIESLGDG